MTLICYFNNLRHFIYCQSFHINDVAMKYLHDTGGKKKKGKNRRISHLILQTLIYDTTRRYCGAVPPGFYGHGNVKNTSGPISLMPGFCDLRNERKIGQTPRYSAELVIFQKYRRFGLRRVV